MWHYWIRVSLGLSIVFLFLLHILDVLNLPLVERLELQAYDMRVRWTMPGTVDPRIVIVDIDEKSLTELGQWPWGRHRLAQLVERLFQDYQVKVMGFDVVFAEPDDSTGLPVLTELAQGPLKTDAKFMAQYELLRTKLERDHLFAQSLKDRNTVMGYVFKYEDSLDHTMQIGSIPEPVLPASAGALSAVPFVKGTGFTGNLSSFQTNAASGGFFDNYLIDEDGIFRRVPLLLRHGEGIYESLGLAVARLALGSPPVQLKIESLEEQVDVELGLEWILLGDRRVPVDERGAILVPYRGTQGSFPYVSAADVIHGRAAPEVLKDAIVLVGTTAPGLLDMRSTPVQSKYAGVEVHANVISGILDGTIRQRPAFTLAIQLLGTLLLGLIMTFVPPKRSPVTTTMLSICLVALVSAINVYIFQVENLLLPLALPALLVLALFVLHMSYGFFVESRGKRQITKLFGQYVPPELVDEMSQNPASFGLDGDSREMTVLFSDVRGFTTLSEGLDPKQLTRLMNELLTPMTHIIHKHRGTIDKYMGDAIMAFWGAPLSDPEHAKNGVLAGLEMLAHLPVMQAEFKARGWPPVKIGVGLNTGVMNVGNMGSEFRMAYTVLGDAVNLGSRLEGLTKPYGVSLLISESTRLAIPDIVCREIDRVRVKGKNEPVIIYEPIALEANIAESERAELVQYQAALQVYRAQRWEEARAAFEALKSLQDRLIYGIYLERIAHFMSNPPGENWDFVFTHTSK